MTTLAMMLALLLDAVLGEVRRAHPLVALGRLASSIERRWHGDSRVRGVLSWWVVVVPVVVIVALITLAARNLGAWANVAVQAVVLYATIGLRSLGEHALPVADAIDRGKLAQARDAVGRMVSRDVQALDATQVAAAATESVLENGNDAVFGALFWFIVLGAPGAVLYRLANTLDAMWGYRTSRYERFGWAAARIDDALNLLPARSTALTYACLGHPSRALRCWSRQAPAWDSPNAGPVMASGAGALGVQLGGAAPYHGHWEERPVLGEGRSPDARSIRDAMTMVRRGAVVWVVLVGLVECVLLGGWHA